jgi:5-methylcytosine-specific restriction enzyme A
MMTAMGKGTTRLCCEPGCGEVLVDAAGGSRCAEHARKPWDRWRVRNPGRSSGYGARWRRLRDAYIAEHPDCEEPECDAPAVDVHHLDRAGPDDATFFDWDNLGSRCARCHRRASRRRR